MRSARSQASSSGRGLVAVIAVSLILAGCTGSTADPSPKPAVTKPAATKPAVESSAPEPKVGDCWNTTPALLAGVIWEGSEAVPCSQNHNAVTYGVGTLPTGLSFATIDFDELKKTKAVTDTCNQAAAHTYLGHANFHPPLSLFDVYFAPSRQQWDAGARWFRCDLGFPDFVTNDRYWLVWEPLPVDLRAAVEADDRPFTICSSAPANGGFAGINDRYGKCGKGMHWVATKSVEMAKSRREPFPGAKPTRARAIQACHSPRQHGVSWAGVKQWEDGQTRAVCWERWSR
jgi:Septum formation